MKIRFTSGGLVTAAVAAVAFDVGAFATMPSPNVELSDSKPSVGYDIGVETSSLFSVPVPSDDREWSHNLEQRFEALARAEALGKIRGEQLQELERLTRMRRHERYPRSADEIIWTRKQKAVTRALKGALQDYVEFHCAASGSEEPPKKAHR